MTARDVAFERWITGAFRTQVERARVRVAAMSDDDVTIERAVLDAMRGRPPLAWGAARIAGRWTTTYAPRGARRQRHGDE